MSISLGNFYMIQLTGPDAGSKRFLTSRGSRTNDPLEAIMKDRAVAKNVLEKAKATMGYLKPKLLTGPLTFNPIET